MTHDTSIQPDRRILDGALASGLMTAIISGLIEEVTHWLELGADPNTSKIECEGLVTTNPWHWLSSLLLRDGTIDGNDVNKAWAILCQTIAYGLDMDQLMEPLLVYGGISREQWLVLQYPDDSPTFMAHAQALHLAHHTHIAIGHTRSPERL
jgi:hypothetical protein